MLLNICCPIMVLWMLLLAVWLSSAGPSVAHSCPDACASCSLQDKNRCLECEAGWTLYHNTCIDIDECGTAQGRCPPDTYCANTEGSYHCRECDQACGSCMGSGPARCRKCAAGYRLTGAKCLDVDECGETSLPCLGLDELCTNLEGSFLCDCADGFIRKNNVCVRTQPQSAQEKGLFEDVPEDEVAVLQQMFFGVVLCALATLAAKGDMVFTSIFMGGVAAMAGYWLSERGDRFLDRFLKGS
ncbi:protein disulfide isomerase CRELD1 isoform X2 [Gadus macrocephalus]|uniref:protein disulfide isomerase CRELD1 isoform X2 n=1 Tax=Gadus macrocephalus TaxID=80720 RepID=UPI0028CB25AB|nr:protein disulfide isomerase CRELD1 isoform X2 [Gadus macrocephalus]